MNSTGGATLAKLKKVTEEVYLIARLYLSASTNDATILGRLLKKLQKEKDVLVKKVEKSRNGSK